ncbi:hypothetical protein M0813_10760 [Anaeramoeba flamelloides]|uniref:Uncharacterized protein n=1 Tax=Anaeramoeba flamelloides TaxID=1746091 RepID=A0ABQ8X1K7_9EUKA|nr:hypothetical protein M0813_10760 [Anaeramoeba flamelloides]
MIPIFNHESQCSSLLKYSEHSMIVFKIRKKLKVEVKQFLNDIITKPELKYLKIFAREIPSIAELWRVLFIKFDQYFEFEIEESTQKIIKLSFDRKWIQVAEYLSGRKHQSIQTVLTKFLRNIFALRGTTKSGKLVYRYDKMYDKNIKLHTLKSFNDRYRRLLININYPKNQNGNDKQKNHSVITTMGQQKGQITKSGNNQKNHSQNETNDKVFLTHKRKKLKKMNHKKKYKIVVKHKIKNSTSKLALHNKPTTENISQKPLNVFNQNQRNRNTLTSNDLCLRYQNLYQNNIININQNSIDQNNLFSKSSSENNNTVFNYDKKNISHESNFTQTPNHRKLPPSNIYKLNFQPRYKIFKLNNTKQNFKIN